MENPNFIFLSFLLILPWFFGFRNLIYANCGLETGIYMLALSLCLLGERFQKFSAWIILIRPEGWLAGLAVFFHRIIQGRKKEVFKQGIHLLLSLLTWAAMGWLLFGTPIPQSILAKSNHLIDRWNEMGKGLSYALFAGQTLPMIPFVVASIRFPDFRKSVQLPLIWALLYILFFSAFAAWWPWYVPPLFVPFWYMSMQAGLVTLRDWKNSRYWKNWIPASTAMLLLTHGFYQVRTELTPIRQSSVACKIRMEGSRLLAEELSRRESEKGNILIEPLGMLSWYGKNLNIIDFPGLSNPEMSGFLSGLPWKLPHRLTDSRTDSAILEKFRPSALVLWPEEHSAFRKTNHFRTNYRLWKTLPYYPAEKRMDSVSIFRRIR